MQNLVTTGMPQPLTSLVLLVAKVYSGKTFKASIIGKAFKEKLFRTLKLNVTMTLFVSKIKAVQSLVRTFNIFDNL